MQLHQCQKLGFKPCSVASIPRPVIHVVQRGSRGIIRCSAATTELPASLKTIVGSFQAVPDPMQRYKQLLFFATKLDVLPDEEHTQENKVKGCVSQVWVSPRLGDDGKIYWRADSDSQLTKGLAALLVQGLSGCTAEEIVRIQPDFISMLGLQQSLTPSRNNGFLNMFKLMQGKALEIYLQQQKEAAGTGNTNSDASTSSATASEDAENTSQAADNSSSSSSGTSGAVSSSTPVADSMRTKLESELKPLKLDIIDDSNKHRGHGGYKGTSSYSGETHFMVEVVSEKFEGLSSLKRHRLVYQIIDAEMGNPVHALSLITKTPGEAGMA